jgi:hypothetical protein
MFHFPPPHLLTVVDGPFHESVRPTAHHRSRQEAEVGTGDEDGTAMLDLSRYLFHLSGLGPPVVVLGDFILKREKTEILGVKPPSEVLDPFDQADESCE